MKILSLTSWISSLLIRQSTSKGKVITRSLSRSLQIYELQTYRFMGSETCNVRPLRINGTDFAEKTGSSLCIWGGLKKNQVSLFDILISITHDVTHKWYRPAYTVTPSVTCSLQALLVHTMQKRHHQWHNETVRINGTAYATGKSDGLPGSQLFRLHPVVHTSCAGPCKSSTWQKAYIIRILSMIAA